MFCKQITYNRSFIKQEPLQNIPSRKSYCLGGASAAYARNVIDQYSLVKTTTKIATICHIVYSIVKGLSQGAYALFLTGNKRDIFIAHFRYNLIFPNLHRITSIYNNRYFDSYSASRFTGSTAAELPISKNTICTTSAEWNNFDWNEYFNSRSPCL